MLAASLALSGHSIRTADNVTSALETIRSGWAQIVTLDLRLGDDDGAEVIIEAQRLGKAAKFVIVSASGAREACVLLGADDWVSKPFDPWMLQMKVQELATNVEASDPSRE